MSDGTNSDDTNLIQFQPYTIQEADKIHGEMGGGDYFKLEQGQNIVRFIPARLGEPNRVVIGKHYWQKPGEKRGTAVTCPRVCLKQPCPMCTHADELNRSGVAADRAVADKLYPRRQVMANVIDRKNPDKGPQTFSFGKKIEDQLDGILRRAASGFIGGDYSHPFEGFDLMIVKSGKDLETNYEVITPKNTTPLHPDRAMIKRWIDEQPDLRRKIVVQSAEDIMRIIRGEQVEGGQAMTTGGGGGGQRRPNIVDGVDADFGSGGKIPF